MKESGLFYRPKMFRLDPEKAKNIQVRGFKRSVQELYPYSLHPHFVKNDNLIAFWIPEIVVIESKLFKVEDEPSSEPSSEAEPLTPIGNILGPSPSVIFGNKIQKFFFENFRQL